MRYVKLTTANGHTWGTSINGTDEEIRRYFLGQEFDVGTYPNEDMQVCVKCEIDGKLYELPAKTL